MQIEVLKSKIHRVTITQANLDYVGSITIDEELLEAANMIEGEKVQIVNVNNGERLETYIIKGERGSGAVCLNGPAARKCVVGDVVISTHTEYYDVTPSVLRGNFPCGGVYEADKNLIEKALGGLVQAILIQGSIGDNGFITFLFRI